MLVLAFDTTGEHGGAGLYRDEVCLANAINRGPARQYSISLFEMVEAVLAEAGARDRGGAGQPGDGAKPVEAGPHWRATAPPLTLGDIELFAVANGPGSFTGIRVGLAAAKGWAAAFGRPVQGVSVFEAMVEEACPEAEWVVPIMDAHRSEFYLALFRRAGRSDGSRFVEQGEGQVMKPQAVGLFLKELPAAESLTCVVRDHDRAAETLRTGLPSSLGWQTVSGTLVRAVARLGLQACRQGSVQSPADLDAYYLRRPDAKVPTRNETSPKDPSPKG
jgi:tRNA threonylcarbamoyladenosine biosynthesis protein TsaB